MEHPLVTNLNDLTEEQLLEKITELQRKLNIAYRTGNAYLIHQVQMALETYQTKYTEKMRGNGDSGFNDIINIS